MRKIKRAKIADAETLAGLAIQMWEDQVKFTASGKLQEIMMVSTSARLYMVE